MPEGEVRTHANRVLGAIPVHGSVGKAAGDIRLGTADERYAGAKRLPAQRAKPMIDNGRPALDIGDPEIRFPVDHQHHVGDGQPARVARTLAEPTDGDLRIYETARSLLRDALAADRDAGRVSPVRLVGVTASGLVGGEQLDLFSGARVSRLNAAMDAVRSRFGDDALDRASAREATSRRRLSDRRPR